MSCSSTEIIIVIRPTSKPRPRGGLTGLADGAATHAQHSQEASAAHATGDVGQQMTATATLLGSAKQMLEQGAAAAPLPPDIEQAGRDTMKVLGEAIATSV